MSTSAKVPQIILSKEEKVSVIKGRAADFRKNKQLPRQKSLSQLIGMSTQAAIINSRVAS